MEKLQNKSRRVSLWSSPSKENRHGSPTREHKSLASAGREPLSPKGQVPAAMQCEPVEQQSETVTPPMLPASASAASALASASAASASAASASATSAPSQHFRLGRSAMDKHATLFASLDGGMPAHISPDPMPLPDGMIRGNRSRFFCENYPSPHSQKHGGYVTEAGHATDDTTRMMARAVSTSLPDGQSLVFQQQYDWWGDLYDFPHPFKMGTVDFKFSTHFYNKLSKNDKKR